MRGNTHIWFGVSSALLLFHPPLWSYALVGLGSLLPDVDHKNSPVGILPCIKHRTVTHSLLACGLALLINPWLGLGYVSHVLLDMLNPTGCPLLWPYTKKFSVGSIKTGSKVETIFRNGLKMIMLTIILFP